MRQYETSYAYGNEPHLAMLAEDGLNEENWATAEALGVRWWQNNDPRDDSISTAMQAGLPIVISNPMYTDGKPRHHQTPANMLVGAYLFPYGVVNPDSVA